MGANKKVQYLRKLIEEVKKKKEHASQQMSQMHAKWEVYRVLQAELEADLEYELMTAKERRQKNDSTGVQ